MDTGEDLFKLGAMSRHGGQVLPALELVPGQGAQITAQAPTEGYVQTDACARAPSLNRALYFAWLENNRARL